MKKIVEVADDLFRREPFRNDDAVISRTGAKSRTVCDPGITLAHDFQLETTVDIEFHSAARARISMSSSPCNARPRLAATNRFATLLRVPARAAATREAL